MPPTPSISYDELEIAIGHRFRNRQLLVEALTHSSAANEAPGTADNQRLEFFGDAILDFLVSDLLYRRFPAAREGELTRCRALLVDEANLADVAGKVGLGPFLHLGRGEEKTGGRTKKSILADAGEALLAAVYLDGGVTAARRVVARLFGPAIAELARGGKQRDFKSELQELLQARQGQAPSYEPLATSGPDHDRTFTFRVLAAGRTIGEGSGRSKKEAQQEAARQALERLVR